MPGTFPRAYANDVPKEGGEPGMEYVPFDRLDIGARNAGVPGAISTGPKPIDHVGSSAGKGAGRVARTS